MASITIRTTGVTDTKMVNTVPVNDYSGDANISVGEYNLGAEIDRGLIKFDLTGIPAGSTIDTALLYLYVSNNFATNTRTKRVYRVKRAWVPAEAGWTNYSTGNAWTTAGCGHTDDRETSDIGNVSISDDPATDLEVEITLTASAVEEMLTGGSFTNNGFAIISDTETDDMIQFHATDVATETLRPKLVITYTPPVTAGFFMIL